MAALPSPSKVAGSHLNLYEAYYLQVDPNCSGTIPAIDAAKFLKKSGLSDAVLSKIWDLSDPLGKGCLDQSGFFVALKLISLAQQGKDLNMSLVLNPIEPPKMGDAPPIPELPKVSVWTIKPQEKSKYNQLFDSLEPINNSLPGSKVKPLMVNSGLPMPSLVKIWDLADMDKDGALDRNEFVIAMHLIYKVLDNNPIPNVLPPELKLLSSEMDVTKTTEVKHVPPPVPIPPVHQAPPIPPLHQPPPVPPLPLTNINQSQMTIDKSSIPSIPWVVSGEDKAKYDVLFHQTDTDKDGFVNGTEIKDVFLQSGLAQNVLAHIWNLCDIKQTGKLNEEQFALAMWLIAQKLAGSDPPTMLLPEMVPPTFRPKPTAVPDLVSSLTSVSYSNPELQMLVKEIDELSTERVQLHQDVTQKQAELRIRQTEVRNMQTELDTLTATLKQLENQKGEAQKRLDDLGAQKTSIESEIEEVVELIAERRAEVDKLRAQVEEQESSLSSQRAELDGKRKELDDLKSEESKLETEVTLTKSRLESLTSSLADTQLQINQAKNKLMSLEDANKQFSELVETFDSAISSGDASSVNDAALRAITPSWEEYDLPAPATTSSSAFSYGLRQEDTSADFSSRNGFQEDTFQNEFTSSSANTMDMAFGASNQDPFKSDAFAVFPSGNDKYDPFQPTSQSGFINNTAINSGTDPFGSDPFESDPFAPARNDSPTPALPPKKSKQPPPRPAPPKQAPTKPSSSKPPVPAPPTHHTPTQQENDPFGGADPFSSGKSPFSAPSNDGFADFANFDQFRSGVVSTWPEASNVFDASADPFSDPFKDPASVWAETKVGSRVTEDGDNPFEFRPSPIGASDKLFKEEDFWEESRRQELDRQQRAKQEQDDFELAIALSRAEVSFH